MTKQVFIHIGHYKTGSSAIQDFLSRNAATLRQRGYLYPSGLRPRNNRTNHGVLSLSLARDYGFPGPGWYDEDIAADDAFAALYNELNQADEDKVILSSEEFVQLALGADPDAALADLKQRLSDYQVTILFHVREPMSLLKSWFNEVNKGRFATRTLPCFFMMIKAAFLGQQPIWEAFARHFGPENIRLLSYRHVGKRHIGEFLQAVGCKIDISDDAEKLVQQALPVETLELTRLAKELRGSLDDHTISRFGKISGLVKKVDEVNALYARLGDVMDNHEPSRLTPSAIFDYYAALLQPLSENGRANQKEADRLRDLGVQAEAIDPVLALSLMKAAHVIRPTGDFINKKIAEYTKNRAGGRPRSS